MGRRFPGSAGGGGGGGGSIPGDFNQYEVFSWADTITWTKPAGITGDRILVHVWGAGGAGTWADSGVGGTGSGGGGGGLAVKYIDVSSLGATETLTIGAGSTSATGIGGTSSFGSHCSATGGNSGDNNTANEGSGAIYGVGGLGSNGDKNQRGGAGGIGRYAAVLIPVAVAADLLLPLTERLLAIGAATLSALTPVAVVEALADLGATVITSAPAVAEA